MRVVAWKCDLRLEVATIVHGILIQHNQGHTPLEDVLVDELGGVSRVLCGVATLHMTPQSNVLGLYLYMCPLLFVQVLELLHEDPLRRVRHVVYAFRCAGSGG